MRTAADALLVHWQLFAGRPGWVVCGKCPNAARAASQDGEQYGCAAAELELRRRLSTADRPQSRCKLHDVATSTAETAGVRAHSPWGGHEGECSDSWASKLGLWSLRTNLGDAGTRFKSPHGRWPSAGTAAVPVAERLISPTRRTPCGSQHALWGRQSLPVGAPSAFVAAEGRYASGLNLTEAGCVPPRIARRGPSRSLLLQAHVRAERGTWSSRGCCPCVHLQCRLLRCCLRGGLRAGLSRNSQIDETDMHVSDPRGSQSFLSTLEVRGSPEGVDRTGPPKWPDSADRENGARITPAGVCRSCCSATE